MGSPAPDMDTLDDLMERLSRCSYAIPVHGMCCIACRGVWHEASANHEDVARVGNVAAGKLWMQVICIKFRWIQLNRHLDLFTLQATTSPF